MAPRSYSSSLEESALLNEAAKPSLSFGFLSFSFFFRPRKGCTRVSGWRLASERSGFSFLFRFAPVTSSLPSLVSLAIKYNCSSAFSATEPLIKNKWKFHLRYIYIGAKCRMHLLNSPGPFFSSLLFQEFFNVRNICKLPQVLLAFLAVPSPSFIHPGLLNEHVLSGS